MAHPFRRFCFSLAKELGKSLNEVLALGSDELSEWMAYSLTLDTKWQENYEKEKELERQRNMSAEEKARLIKELLGGNR